jgi:hypothetical protein
MPNEQLISWLLETDIPSLRYLTRKNLQQLDDNDPLVMEDLHLMNSTGPIPTILAGQTGEGNWEGERSYYTPKYVSSHWSMLLLHELGLNSEHKDFRRGIDFMLKDAQEEILEELEQSGYGLACFWGNLLRYSNPRILENKERLIPIIEYLTREGTVTDWRCVHNDNLPCAWGAARTLWALASLPTTLYSERVSNAIQSGIHFLLEEFDLQHAAYPTPGTTHTLWTRLSFPLFYQTDILFVLRVLVELGEVTHPGAEGGINWLISKRKRSGRWSGASPYRKRTWPNFADRAETDRWISYFAAYILMNYES